MPGVFNIRSGNAPAEAVYVGRPSKWGNPFEIGKDGDREYVIFLYEKMLLSNKELRIAAARELKGKDLVCHCAPKMCHADVLLEIANMQPGDFT